MYNLRQAMRALCPQAVEVVKRCLASEDEKVALAAAQVAMERGFGRVDLHVDASVEARFVIAPDVMPLNEWLLRRGQTQAQRPRDASGARTQAATSTRPALELTANDIPETKASTSAQGGNGGEAAPAEHGAIERRKLLN
jgi:hypothetical protein